MRHPFSRDFWKLENLRQTWEYKSIAFILRAVVFLIVLFYALFATTAIWEWTKTAWVRHQPITRAETLMAEARATGDFDALTKWLQRRQQSELQSHAQLIEDNVEEVPFTLFSWPIQATAAAQDLDGTLFWQMFSRYRLRFDLIRCGNPVLLDKISTLMRGLAAFQPGADALAAIERDPQKLADLLQKVMDYDAVHPARNDPDHTCSQFGPLTDIKGTPMPRETWAQARHLLRMVTEQSIAEMRAGKPPVAEPAE